MSSIEIPATLKKDEKDNTKFVFNVPKNDEYATVNHGDNLSWKVIAKDLKHDPGNLDTRVNLLLVFHGSNSEIPPQGGVGGRNWPFVGDPWWKHGLDPNDSTQSIFAFGFESWETDTEGYLSKSNPRAVRQDVSMQKQRIVYNYTLLAYIPKNQLPSTVPTNSDHGMHQWPELGMRDGGKFLIVKHDPELYVDEC